MRLDFIFKTSRQMCKIIFKSTEFEEEERKNPPIHVAQRRALDCILICVLASSKTTLYTFIYGHSINRMSYGMLLNCKSMHLLCNIFHIMHTCTHSQPLGKKSDWVSEEKRISTTKNTSLTPSQHDIASKQSNSDDGMRTCAICLNSVWLFCYCFFRWLYIGKSIYAHMLVNNENNNYDATSAAATDAVVVLLLLFPVIKKLYCQWKWIHTRVHAHTHPLIMEFWYMVTKSKLQIANCKNMNGIL